MIVMTGDARRALTRLLNAFENHFDIARDGDEADDAAGVLVVGESWDGDDFMGGEGLVDDVEVVRANRAVGVLSPAGAGTVPVHRHEADVPGEFDSGRQDLGTLVGSDGERVGGAQDRTRDRTIVVGQARGDVDRDDGPRLDGGEPVEDLHGFRERSRERAVGAGAHDAVDPGVREEHFGPCGRVLDGTQRLAAKVDDAHARFLGGGKGTAMAALLEEVGGRPDSSAREDRAGVEGVPAVVSTANKGGDTVGDPVTLFIVAAILRTRGGIGALAVPAHGQVRMAHDRGRNLACDVEHVTVRITLGNRLINALFLQFPRVGEGQGSSINREHAPYSVTPRTPGAAACATTAPPADAARVSSQMRNEAR